MGNISGNRSPHPPWAPEGTRLLQAISMAPACFLPTPPPHPGAFRWYLPISSVGGLPVCRGSRLCGHSHVLSPLAAKLRHQDRLPEAHRDASSARQMWSRLVRGEWPASQLAGRHPLVNQQFEPCTCPDARVTPSRLVITPVGPDRLGCCLPGASGAVGNWVSFWSPELCCSLLLPAVAAVLAKECGRTVGACPRPVSALSVLAPEFLSGALLPAILSRARAPALGSIYGDTPQSIQ